MSIEQKSTVNISNSRWEAHRAAFTTIDVRCSVLYDALMNVTVQRTSTIVNACDVSAMHSVRPITASKTRSSLVWWCADACIIGVQSAAIGRSYKCSSLKSQV
eukprot:1598-Heterococcus_DN1.PRE.3